MGGAAPAGAPLVGHESPRRPSPSILIEAIRFLGFVQRPPEIPRSSRTIRSPFFAELHELFRRRQFSAPENLRESFAHAVIIDRPDIGPAEIEKKKHLEGQPADDAH